MLVEFDYNNHLTPSFPGVIAPLEELWATWAIKNIRFKTHLFRYVTWISLRSVNNEEFQFDTLWAVMQIMLGAFFWPALIV
ncbi:hypothetical protein AAUPMC_15440, partial [Pasteurella multocida subsp. multocida str. Anand1_cattle]